MDVVIEWFRSVNISEIYIHLYYFEFRRLHLVLNTKSSFSHNLDKICRQFFFPVQSGEYFKVNPSTPPGILLFTG